MFDQILKFSLKNRVPVIAFSLFLTVYGLYHIQKLSIDVFPNLNRPRVVILTEAHGWSPEEVEARITLPIETALNGASNVLAVRSDSGVGLSIVYVEFDWDSDIYIDRQIVNERLQLVQENLPESVTPTLTPISSIMGQIQMIGVWSENEDVDPLELRTLADWVIRQRLLTIPGISQVFVMGGERKQFQVLVDPDAMRKYGVTLQQVDQAVAESNRNAVGGYLDEQGANELLVRTLGRVQKIEDLEKLVIANHEDQPILLKQVARIVEAGQIKRGDSSAFARNEEGVLDGGDAIILTVNKQPDADTRRITEDVIKALDELEAGLPDGVHIEPLLYSQKQFIDRAIENVIEALRDGAVLVTVILFIFLLNFRTTLITLTAIPLSIVITSLVFAFFGLSINTMTLGGLAVAIGELVDDAIVDVENIFRRLGENKQKKKPDSPLLVVYRASLEIRNSIVFGTMIVILVFLPLFALSGLEGRLFAPLGIAYIVSILSSLVVSLTVTPILSYWLLPQSKLQADHDSFFLRFLKKVGGGMIRFSLTVPRLILGVASLAVVLSGLALTQLESDFLPEFNEGSFQVNIGLPPGTSLAESRKVAHQVEDRLAKIEDVDSFVVRTGRAELDEHAMDVNTSEIIIEFNPETTRTREEILAEIRSEMQDIPGIIASSDQPLAHLISHMLSGVKADVGIKIYGDDLTTLRRLAGQMKAEIASIEGVTDLFVEQQAAIPQLRIELDRDQLALYGLRPEEVNQFVETAMQGRVVSQVLDGQRIFDLVVRMQEEYREDLQKLRRLAINLPDGGVIPLEAVADIYEATGPNIIRREQVRRRIILQCNVAGRGVVDVVNEIKERLEPVEAELPTGYFVEYSGQFESQESASRLIMAFFALSLIGILIVLYTMFGSFNFSLQVLAAVPMAFIGCVIALLYTGQTLTIASMVGFISLGGIASRNGILLLNHYLHLVEFEGETWSKEMIVRAGQERLAPVLMTALTSGIGLVPLAFSAGESGREILYPVATVIIGGLISSTILEFLVRPALFWLYGMKAGQRLMETKEDESETLD
ncbi:Cobalt-zinc-cadmium resistance protein CzcA [Polystyrenella longa]|uniref:Cobalt-zinc-cadmium resistance protein CzcA n=1 Tax=Polystyrenella longa TaxID=2528007 RepID=A0A518CHC6_9PLAN|nr:efflux RND transporter permease subunit [Polystyrenella longa]QDU78623.1 Cobalt-zinc-cadmium resistance protein CzcA [Polystyrenella longa]